MTLKLAKVTKPFLDPDGNEEEGATFTVRRRMSFDAQQKYQSKLTELIDDPESLSKMTDEERNKVLAKVAQDNAAAFSELTKLLLDDCLLRIDGVEGEDGQPWPLATFHTFDSHYVAQVSNQIQSLNVPEKKGTGSPNSPKPSKRS